MSDQWVSIPVSEFEDLARRARAAQAHVNVLGAGNLRDAEIARLRAALRKIWHLYPKASEAAQIADKALNGEVP